MRLTKGHGTRSRRSWTGTAASRRGDTGQERFDWAGRRQVEEHLIFAHF